MKCDYCKSGNIHVGNRGFNLLTGFVGSSELVMTCLDCGYKKKISKAPKQINKDKVIKKTIVFASIVISLLLLIIIFKMIGL